MENRIAVVGCFLAITLTAHFFVSRIKTPVLPANTKKLHWSYNLSLGLSCILLISYVGILIYLFREDISWPHVGSLSIFFFILLCPAILFHIFFITSSLTHKKLPIKRFRARVISIGVGGILGSQIPMYAQHLAMQNFEQKHTSQIHALTESLPDPCNHNSPYLKIVPEQPWPLWGTLWYTTDNYVLSFPGRSADIDGSTIYYASEVGKFTIFHNDNTEESNRFKKYREHMKKCKQRIKD